EKSRQGVSGGSWVCGGSFGESRLGRVGPVAALYLRDAVWFRDQTVTRRPGADRVTLSGASVPFDRLPRRARSTRQPALCPARCVLPRHEDETRVPSPANESPDRIPLPCHLLSLR